MGWYVAVEELKLKLKLVGVGYVSRLGYMWARQWKDGNKDSADDMQDVSTNTGGAVYK
jgi:hypothetical protein